MIISKKHLKKFSELKEQGDIKQISDLSKFTRQTVSRALTTGRCQDKLFPFIKAFYEEKEQKTQHA